MDFLQTLFKLLKLVSTFSNLKAIIKPGNVFFIKNVLLPVLFTFIFVNAAQGITYNYSCQEDASAVYKTLGSTYTYHGNWIGYDVKTFWKFTLTGITPPSGQSIKIIRADLVLYGGNVGGTGSNPPTATMYRVWDNNWSETTVTYNNSPEFGTALGTFSYPGNGTELRLGGKNFIQYIQTIVNRQQSGVPTVVSFGSTAPNNYVSPNDENCFRMISREYSNPAYRPRLEVEFSFVPEIDPANTPVIYPAIGSLTTPITHQNYFIGERELFGYAPLYTPAAINFSGDNTPYIRVGENAEGFDVYMEATEYGIIQTLDAQGNWVYLRSFIDAIKTAYPSWNGEYRTGVNIDERIIFDDDGDAYTLVLTHDSLGFNVLLHSTDNCQTWTVYPLPASCYWFRLEAPDGHNDTSSPPVIVSWPYSFSGSNLYLICPEKELNGTLDIPSPVAINTTGDACIAPNLNNISVTRGNYTHVVYLRVTGENGTPQYIVTYDHTTNTVSTAVLLGTSDSPAPDSHDGPVITIDSSGYLHVVFGSHHGNFKYTKSNSVNNISEGWTTPVAIGRLAGGGGWTYPSLVCDQDDTLHIVGRYAGLYYRFGLWYIRKSAGQAFEDMGPLVMPDRGFYSHWYNVMSIDSYGRLFLSYIYLGNQYDRNLETTYEIDAYMAKWPWESPYLTDPINDVWHGVQAHEPCIIMSEDSGDSWRLLITTDF